MRSGSLRYVTSQSARTGDDTSPTISQTAIRTNVQVLRLSLAFAACLAILCVGLVIDRVRINGSRGSSAVAELESLRSQLNVLTKDSALNRVARDQAETEKEAAKLQLMRQNSTVQSLNDRVAALEKSRKNVTQLSLPSVDLNLPNRETESAGAEPLKGYSPANTAIVETRPIFSWPELPGVPVKVEVLSADHQVIGSSSQLDPKAKELRCWFDLKAGRHYFWRFFGTDALHPLSSEPIHFYVLNENQLKSLTDTLKRLKLYRDLAKLGGKAGNDAEAEMKIISNQ